MHNAASGFWFHASLRLSARARNDAHIGHHEYVGVQTETDLTTSAKTNSAKTNSVQEELDRHFATIDQRLPASISRFLHWLRKPSSLIVRIAVSLLLIVGGVFSFLPILGLWMLPLGLIIIAQDLPFLQPPLVKALSWIEARWFKKS